MGSKLNQDHKYIYLCIDSHEITKEKMDMHGQKDVIALNHIYIISVLERRLAVINEMKLNIV